VEGLTIQTSRLVGIICALVLILGVLPSIGGFFMLIGIVCVLIALKGYADFYKDGNIFHNAIYAIIFEIIGVVVSIGILLYIAMSFLTSLGINNLVDLSSWQNIDWQHAVDISTLTSYLIPIILALVALFAFTIFASLYFRKSMSTLSEKTGVKLFHTTGTVFLIGALLTIILFGLLIIWVSFILLLISFYVSKPLEQSPQPQ